MCVHLGAPQGPAHGPGHTVLIASDPSVFHTTRASRMNSNEGMVETPKRSSKTLHSSLPSSRHDMNVTSGQLRDVRWNVCLILVHGSMISSGLRFHCTSASSKRPLSHRSSESICTEQAAQAHERPHTKTSYASSGILSDEDMRSCSAMGGCGDTAAPRCTTNNRVRNTPADFHIPIHPHTHHGTPCTHARTHARTHMCTHDCEAPDPTCGKEDGSRHVKSEWLVLSSIAMSLKVKRPWA